MRAARCVHCRKTGSTAAVPRHPAQLDLNWVQFGKDMADYSAGQKKKVLLAKSLCEPAHLYIWDEPLNYIDIFSRMQIEQLLLEYRPTLLFVEHDSRFRDTVATKTVDLV